MVICFVSTDFSIITRYVEPPFCNPYVWVAALSDTDASPASLNPDDKELAKTVNFVPWDDKKLCCAAHTAVSALDAPSSFVKEASPAKKSRFSSLKTVGAEELEDSLLEDSAEELDSAELLEATLELETEDEDCALLEDLALELLTAERSCGMLVIQWLSMSLQSDWRRDSIMERFE